MLPRIATTADNGPTADLPSAPTFINLPYRRDGINEPGPRCGHTLTPIHVIEGGTPRLVLFGGATALESGSNQAAPAGAGGIREFPRILAVREGMGGGR